ncbi:polysaccharide biosynthesis tyrosine autokinase [Skermania sp. ID1734]|uniref:polysaccharide biosynthesis tyrosine autokinase n=1 Tax=Skermania sp. ID1734 TaxID=2597516 RepID=UPI00117D16E8|nr:polysaccharide biosynthesis tyrosine autokinase [Skermania sp. ID1734]TSD93184.1 polysaccharide biosynthesis tyrosine autokinase [Skermania sp. ID1734]
MSRSAFRRILRRRWKTIFAVALLGLLLGALYAWLVPPKYTATTRLFASTRNSSVLEMYQGNLASQQRIVSYAGLATGHSVAESTIKALHLDMTPQQLLSRVKADTTPESVLLDIVVTDTDPQRASDIANTVADQLVALVTKIETPPGGGVPASRLTIVDQAQVPSKPSSFPPYLIVGVGLLIGLVVGAVLAAIRDRLDSSIIDPLELDTVPNLTGLGAIPYARKLAKQPIIEFDADSTPAAEAFRALRTQLHFLQVDNPPRAIVVTSARAGEGKSITALNLALALAAGGDSVALLDCDLRRPVLADLLGCVNTVGVTTVLAGRIGLYDALQATQIPNLVFLAAGDKPANPAALLGSGKARAMIAELKSHYNYIVLDSPPLLPVIDAAELGKNADGVMMCVRYGATKKPEIFRALTKLTSIDVNVLGGALTMTRGEGDLSYGYTYTAAGAENPVEQEWPEAIPSVVPEAAAVGSGQDNGSRRGRHSQASVQ